VPATPTELERPPRLRARVTVLEPEQAAWGLNPAAFPGEVCALARGDAVWIGVGVAWRARWEQAPQSGAMQAVCSDWLERLPGAPDAEFAAAPWIWGGRAFFERAPVSPWTGWPAAELRVPRHLIVHAPGRTRALSLVDEPLPSPRTPGPRAPGATVSCEPLPARDAWVAHAERARDAVVQGLLNKLVPVRASRFSSPAGGFDAARYWDALAGAPGARYLWRSGAQTFAGRTPELLLELTDEALRTVALAGTAPRGADPERDRRLGEALLADAKIQDEHQAVVRGIAARLRQLGLALEPPQPPRLRRLAEAQHVETPLRAARGQRGLWELVEALHPTPALGGEPQAAAQRWLAEHELLERGWFGAPLGWVDRRGDGAAWVTIRGALLEGAQAWGYAGAGVVAESNPAAEWDETELKLKPVTQALEAARGEDL